MAVRFNADADSVYGTYNLGGLGMINYALGGYFYFEGFDDSSVAFILEHSSNGRRHFVWCYTPASTVELRGGDAVNQISFSPQPPLNTWVYIEISSPNTIGGTTSFRWTELDSGVVGAGFTDTNSTEDSVQGEVEAINGRGTEGFESGLRAAYFRAYETPSPDDATFLARAAQTDPAGTFFWWPLATDTDLSDGSGNGRPPSVLGTITTEASPELTPPVRRYILVPP